MMIMEIPSASVPDIVRMRFLFPFTILVSLSQVTELLLAVYTCSASVKFKTFEVEMTPSRSSATV